MKKIYCSPAISVMAVDSANLMAASPTEPSLGINNRTQEKASEEMFTKRSSGSLWQNEAEE